MRQSDPLILPIEKVPFVGPTYAKRLKKLQIEKIKDLLTHFPFRYEDLTEIKKIGKAKVGETVTLKAKVKEIKNIRTKKGKLLTTGLIVDETGSLQVVWFNQPYIPQNVKKGTMMMFSGKVDPFNYIPTLVSPEYEPIKNKKKTTDLIHTGRLVPVYPETAKVSSKWLRSRTRPLLDKYVNLFTDFLPYEVKERHHLLNLSEAIYQIHFPDNLEKAKKAQKRLAFDELFLIALLALKKKADWKKKKLPQLLKINREKLLHFLNSLPFKLTKTQKRSIKELLLDLKKDKPMNRLLQGDVGSGKTVVAASAILTAFLNNLQSAVMAPTEILAEQHFQSISQFLSPFNPLIALKTSSKRKMSENPDIVIGTHALIAKKAEFKNLGLVVIDEQHRFGVKQRATLRKKGFNPHVLTLTATPIPRTLALTLYGDLDLSLIEELPPGRQVVRTHIVPPQKREKAYQFIRKKTKEGQQVFIICPLIEESEILQTKAAKDEFKRLKDKVFPNLKLGLLHGRLKSKEKNEILGKFRDKKLNILVATPVVEVGIDIPNATVMIIEGAERFGLAQLHQLRGRVGRSDLPSYCLLFTDSTTTQTTKRLKSLEKYYSGLKLAEIDLKIRGPGEVFGTRQHGLPNLKVASLTDLKLIEETRVEAQKVLKSDPKLKSYPLLREKLEELEEEMVEAN